MHPYALNVIATVSISESTHSGSSEYAVRFLDGFEPEDIVVVERNGQATEFNRPDTEKLTSWLEDYSLGETWEKNPEPDARSSRAADRNRMRLDKDGGWRTTHPRAARDVSSHQPQGFVPRGTWGTMCSL